MNDLSEDSAPGLLTEVPDTSECYTFAYGPFKGMRLEVDPTLPPGVVRVKGPNNEVRIVNIGDPETDPPRLAILRVTPEAYLDLMRNGVHRPRPYVVTEGIPADAVCIRGDYDCTRHTFRLVLQSREFAPVPRGWSIPELAPPTCHALTDEPE
jgi:hypothetical protein